MTGTFNGAADRDQRKARDPRRPAQDAQRPFNGAADRDQRKAYGPSAPLPPRRPSTGPLIEISGKVDVQGPLTGAGGEPSTGPLIEISGKR